LEKTVAEKQKEEINKLKRELKAALKNAKDSTGFKDGQNAAQRAEDAKNAAKKNSEELTKKSQDQAKNIDKKTEAESGPLYMNDVKCFNLITITPEGDMMAFEAEKVDMYKPKFSGVFNVVAKLFDDNNDFQKWSYNSKSRSIESSGKFPKILSEGPKSNAFIFYNMNMKNQ
jgi:hypothetical protein